MSSLKNVCKVSIYHSKFYLRLLSLVRFRCLHKNKHGAESAQKGRRWQTENGVTALYASFPPAVQIPALIPFIDMANHANSAANPGSVYFECETNSVKIQLNKPIVNGEELFIHYGPRTNAKFLLHNGFVPQQPNPDDLSELKIGLHRTSPNFDAKMQHLAAASIVPTNNQPSKNVVFSFQLQMEASAESIKQSPLFVFAKVFVSDGDLVSIDAVQNTQKAIKFVYDRLNLLLRGYKAANQQDSDVFNGSDSQRLKDAEEAILKSHLKCLEEVI